MDPQGRLLNRADCSIGQSDIYWGQRTIHEAPMFTPKRAEYVCISCLSDIGRVVLKLLLGSEEEKWGDDFVGFTLFDCPGGPGACMRLHAQAPSSTYDSLVMPGDSAVWISTHPSSSRGHPGLGDRSRGYVSSARGKRLPQDPQCMDFIRILSASPGGRLSTV